MGWNNKIIDKCLKKIKKQKNKKNIAVIRLSGVIGKKSGLSSGLCLETLQYLDKLSKIKNLAAVVLIINSPGGSPVQSDLISRYIKNLVKKNAKEFKSKKIPIYSFCEDVAASGGYWLALTADEIYAAKSSIIGSIGVISAGFGFVDAIKKIGIERRVYTQGANKSVLDPFQKEKAADIELINNMQQDVHADFIEHVKASRGKKIKAKDEDVFNGKFWTGVAAKKLGLIDGIAYYEEFIEKKFGENIEFKNLSPKQGFFRKKINSKQGYLSHNLLQEIANYLDESLIWERYKL